MEQQTPVIPKGLQSPTQPAAPPSPKASSSSSRAWIWLLVFAAAAGGAYYEWPNLKKIVPTENSAPAGKRGGRGGAGGVIPVVASKVQRGSIKVYFNALGTVTPIYTVTVKSRVDGELMKVMFTEGQLVRQGDPLIEIDPRPYQAQLEQAEGNMAHDQALLENARVDLERYKVLNSQQAIPEQQLATQVALVNQYIGTIKTDQAAIDTAKLNLVYAHITSPITGQVGLRLVDPGNIVHATDTNGLVVITQLDPISVIFTLPEDEVPDVVDKIHAGQKLMVEAWDRDQKNKLADGTLETVDNQIDPTTGTLKLRANFDNHLNKLFPSQFVNVRLLVEQRNGVTLVSNSAIQRNTQGVYAWLIKPDQSVTVQNIELGPTEGDETQVTKGLKPGDTVVMVGVDKLQDGTKVNAQLPGARSGRSKT
ncbi:MAG TPA: MdtA/MuxA family multidrug efflux RND transporter periplasmic adaptor subunit [Bryobacteraceae bacterium]|nr:MdtA/MuxA family multidrug efflux RND transporter periplasmic adaptor subunit [Bryobacteraceae bacterium]